MRFKLWIPACFSLVLSLLISPRISFAQVGSSPSPSATSNSGPAANADSSKPVHVESVSSSTLKPYIGRKIEVQGIMGQYIGNKELYNFRSEDGADIEVHGDYESMGTTWILTARVAEESNKIVLEEIGRSAPSSAPNRLPLIAGCILLGAAVVSGAWLGYQRRGANAGRSELAGRGLEKNAPGHSDGSLRESPQSTANGTHENVGSAKGPGTIITIGVLEVLSGPHAGQKIPLDSAKREFRIGRTRESGVDILLDRDEQISGYHGSIFRNADGRFIYHDGSSNGSEVDGKLIHRSDCELHSGSQIDVGGTALRLTLRFPAEPGSAAAPRTPESAPNRVNHPVQTPVGGRKAPTESAPPVPHNPRKAETIAAVAPVRSARAPATSASYGAELEVTRGTDSGARRTITGPVTSIGREDVDWILNDVGISRRHALLTLQDNKFVLSDAGSTHGTRVNGERIDQAGRLLVNGDEFVLGKDTTIVFHRIGGAE